MAIRSRSATCTGRALLVFGLLACGGGGSSAKDAGMRDAGSCLKDLSLNCMPAFTADFPSIYQNVLRKGCGITGTSCHGPTGAAGIVFADMSKAYDYLLGHVDGRARVVP